MGDRQLWLIKGILGLLCVGFGLCLLGEAVARKIAGSGWFWIGGLSLAVFNFGLCLLFDSHNHQLRWQGSQQHSQK